MGAGIHVRLVVRGVDACPVASLSEDFEIESITTDRRADVAGGGIVGEVTIDHDAASAAESTQAELVFRDGGHSVYRYTNESGDCPCGRIPDTGCPIRALRAASGALVVTFLAPDIETVQSVVTDLNACCTSVRVQRLAQTTTDDRSALIVVDRTAFTTRQFEVLQTAHEMGYFDQPKQADSTAVATALGISVATFSEHLAVAQEKLLDQLLAGSEGA
ncbi:helix-turn-helix domain-containing protein [Haladaptatus sp. DJG-WS-42]|uniref:helix-turn-helix domain-containing protein n=1 Tax=Haladaptatus sp. DJG-WS-42 TaxID=3120516 RepID=UPI0030CDE58C